MATTGQSRPSAAVARSRPSSILPQYEPATHPLNEAAQRALRDLRNTHSLNSVKILLTHADKKLSETAAEINDRSYHRIEKERRRKAKRAQQGVEDVEEEQRRQEEAKEFEKRVETQTVKIEIGVRGLIDSQARIEAVEAALGEVHGNIVAGGGLVAPTQSTLGASQFRQTKRRRFAAADDSDGEESGGDEDEEGENVGIMTALKKKTEEREGRYHDLSLRARYANHNSYIHFKKLLHDATHPGEDAPPLPHASTWFPSDPRDAANGSASQNPGNDGSAHNADEDGESDLEVTSERISIKCPITLRPMKEPVTSTICPHSFEKTAILEMIERSTLALDGGTWRRGLERILQCPVCGVALTCTTLKEDPVLIRKIKRLQAAQAEDPEDGFGSSPSHNNRTPGGTQRNGHGEVEVGSEDDTQSTVGKYAVRVKSEKATQSQATRGRRPGRTVVDEEDDEGDGDEEEAGEQGDDMDEARRPPASSGGVIVDLGEEDEDEDEDEDEEGEGEGEGEETGEED